MISNISRSGRINMGGIESIQVVPISEVTDVTPAINGKVSITLASGGSWRSVSATFGTKNIADAPTFVGRQQAREVKIEGKIAGSSPTQLEQLKAYCKNGFIAKIKDNNGLQRLVGNPDEPLFFVYDSNSGSMPDDYNGSDFSIQRTLRNSPPFID